MHRSGESLTPLAADLVAVIGCSATILDTSTLAMAFPSSRVSCWPVAVVTIASSWKGALMRTKSAVAASPALTVADASAVW